MKADLTILLAVFLTVSSNLAAQNAPGRGGGGNAGVARLQAFSRAAVENGQKLFGTNCAGCHGANARGGTGKKGPDLIRAVIVLDDDNGRQIGEFLKYGRPQAGMPKFDLPDAQVGDIATFLHREVTFAAERSNYKLLDILTGDPKAGEAYFNGAGGCAKCHSGTGDLKGIGARSDPAAIQSLIVSGGGAGRGGRGGRGASRTAVTATITTASGEKASGVLIRLTDFDVTIRDADGSPRSWLRSGDSPKVELKNPLQGHVDLLTKYTDADIHNLTAWLVSLK